VEENKISPQAAPKIIYDIQDPIQNEIDAFNSNNAKSGPAQMDFKH
jgi:uncharacterized surface anchored protein